MKKVIRYLLLIIAFLSFSSCNSKDDYDPKDIDANDRPFAIETMQKIITALDEKDSEALAALFSEDARENYDIDEQIEKAFEYYNGKSVTSVEDVDSCGNASTHIKDGLYKNKSIRFKLYNMETDAGQSYTLDVIYVLVDEDNPSRIGLSKIYFKDPEDNVGFELAIGAKLKD